MLSRVLRLLGLFGYSIFVYNNSQITNPLTARGPYLMRWLLIFLSVMFSKSVLAEDSGKVLFNQLCANCHVSQGGKRIAPPMFAVKQHVKMAYPKREEFIHRIVGWVKEPDAEIALMQGAVKKFGVMPKQDIDDKALRRVAGYLYE